MLFISSYMKSSGHTVVRIFISTMCTMCSTCSRCTVCGMCGIRTFCCLCGTCGIVCPGFQDTAPCLAHHHAHSGPPRTTPCPNNVRRCFQYAKALVTAEQAKQICQPPSTAIPPAPGTSGLPPLGRSWSTPTPSDDTEWCVVAPAPDGKETKGHWLPCAALPRIARRSPTPTLPGPGRGPGQLGKGRERSGQARPGRLTPSPSRGDREGRASGHVPIPQGTSDPPPPSPEPYIGTAGNRRRSPPDTPTLIADV